MRLLKPIYRNLNHAGLVKSLGPAAWFRYNTGITVTGSGVSQWDDQSGNGRHLKQGTDANRPVALLHTGTNYLYLPGVAGNYASTPDSAANSITGDIDIRVRVSLDDWTPTATSHLCAKHGNDGAHGYYLAVTTTGALLTEISGDGTDATAYTSSSVTGFTDGTLHWVRVFHSATTGACTFYTSDDDTNDVDAVTWVQLGSAVAGAAKTIFDGSAPLEVGARAGGAYFPSNGKIYRALVYAGTTLKCDFNPADATDQASSFTASTGETWTVNTSGAKPAQIVGSSRLLGDGSNHKMACDTYTANQPRTIYALAYGISWTAADYLCSGVGAEAGITQVTATPQIGLNAGSAAAANGDFALSSWKVICAVINGASSSLQVNNGTAATGNAGANNPAGLKLFSNNAGSGYFNGMIKELIDFPTAHDATQRARVARSLGRVGQLGI